jgi:predicted KAP-like P-loop ATPase
MEQYIMSEQIFESAITSLSEDKLNRVELVNYVAEVVRSCDVSESNAIGICGKWGTGKTSFVNMVKDSLKNEPKIIFLEFNPWFYSAQHDLVNQFFSMLSMRMTSNIKKRVKKIAKTAAHVMEIASPIFNNDILFKLIKEYANQLSTRV